MKILFVCCYVNNSHFIDITKQLLDQNLVNCQYKYICLNDAPRLKEDDYLGILDILTGDDDCYQKIKESAQKNNFIHIEIPQSIHESIKKNPNQGGPRHIDNFNWFNKNLNELYPEYKDFDFLCYIDADAFLVKPLDLSDLANFDLAAPIININGTKKYPHTGLFFINLKTVDKIQRIIWDNTQQTDTGSEMAMFLKQNPQYKIKSLGNYIGYSYNNWVVNNHTISKLKMVDLEKITKSYNNHEDYSNERFLDTWYDKHFIHLRAGSSFLLGCSRHRDMSNNSIKLAHEIYCYKIKALIEEFNLNINYIHPLLK